MENKPQMPNEADLEQFKKLSMKGKAKKLLKVWSLRENLKRVFGSRVTKDSLEEKALISKAYIATCNEYERCLIKTELEIRKISFERSVSFSLGWFPLFVSVLALLTAIFADFVSYVIFYIMLEIVMILVGPLLIRMESGIKSKCIFYLLNLIEQYEKEQDKGKKDGNTYIVTVKKES